MTPHENRILGDLQEQCSILQQALEDVLKAKGLEDAVKTAGNCLTALASVDTLISPRIPTWVGVELHGVNTNVKICIGLNQEDGHEVSWRMSEDKDWIPCQSDISVRYGEDEKVFDDKENLIL